MLINSSKINIIDYLNKHDISGVMLYGANFDTIADNVNVLLSIYQKDSVSKDSIVNITSQQLKTQPLSDFMYSQNLFRQNTNIIYIQNPRPGIYNQIKQTMSNYTGKNLLLIREQILVKSNTLLKFFSDQSNLLAVVHYEDNQVQIQNFIKQEIHKYNLKIPSITLLQVQQILQDQSRGFIRNEIQNISQALEQGLITQDNIITTIIKSLVHKPRMETMLQYLTGDIDLMLIQKNQNEILKSPVATIRILIYFLLRIKRLKYLTNFHNCTIRQIAAKLKPPIFYTQYNLWETLVKRWSNYQINQTLYLLHQTNKIIRTTVGNSPILRYVLLCILTQNISYKHL